MLGRSCNLLDSQTLGRQDASLLFPGGTRGRGTARLQADVVDRMPFPDPELRAAARLLGRETVLPETALASVRRPLDVARENRGSRTKEAV